MRFFSGFSLSELLKVLTVFLIFVLFNLLWFYEISWLSYFVNTFIIVLTVVLFFLYKIIYKELLFCMFFFALIIVFKFISSFFSNDFIDLNVLTPFFFGMALALLTIKYDKDFFLLKSMYYFTFIYAVVILLVLLLGVDPNNIWNASQNTSSQIFVILGSFFIIYKPVVNKLKYKVVFYTLIFMICIFSFGRSGILTSLMLLIVCMLHAYFFQPKKVKIIYLLFFLFSSVVVLINFNLIIDVFNGLSVFDYIRVSGITDSYRKNMIYEFFQAYDVSVFLFGIDFSTLPYISSFSENPHNGFIFLHARLGVLALFIYLSVLWVAFCFLAKKDFFSFLALIVMLLRFGTDSVSGIVLIPMFFLFVYSFYIRPVKSI